MKLYEILDIAIMYLGLEEELVVQGANRTSLNNKKIKCLIRCANTIYSEIATDYMRLRHKEKIYAIDNRVSYQSFEKRIIDIEKIIKENKAISYTIYPNYLEVSEDGELEIIYHYLPKELELDSEVAYNVCLAPTTFASGVASEYALVNNMYDEALVYERKFKEGMRANQHNKKSQTIKSRRWL